MCVIRFDGTHTQEGTKFIVGNFLSEVVDIRPHTIQVQLVQEYLLSCQNEAANPSNVINSLFGIGCSGKSNEG